MKFLSCQESQIGKMKIPVWKKKLYDIILLLYPEAQFKSRVTPLRLLALINYNLLRNGCAG